MNTKENGKKFRKQTHDVYVGHVPKVINEEKLRTVFSLYGEIVDVICRHGQGNGPLGYAIIKFKHKEDVDTLLKEVDKVHVIGYEMDVRLGVKSNSSSENEDGAQGKSVSFSEQISYVPIPSKSGHMMDTNLSRKDGKSMSTHNEPNGKQVQVVEIICTYVDSSVTFHGCYVQRFDELQNIRLKLNSICPNLVRLNRKPMMKRVYAALYEDFHWYRCVVRQISAPSKPGVCIVEYIDYGNIAEVFYSHIVDLPEPLQKVNPCAVKCVFSNLMCNPSCRNDVTYLHHLVNKRMTLSAVLKTYSSWGIPEYQVHNCSSNGIDVVNELVRNGYAVYRSQAYSKPSHNLENPGSLKAHENKPRKAHPSSSKGPPKKAAAKEVCNGTTGKREAQNGICEGVLVKSPKSASPDHPESSEEFVPKRIIKRGCEINGANNPPNTPPPVSEVPKCESVSRLLKVDCVLANLKLVNNIRNLVSFPVDDDLINDAVALLSDANCTMSHEVHSVLEEAHKRYQEALNSIKKCTDEKLLPDLKDKRDQEKSELQAALKHFLQGFDSSLLAKQKRIQELITALGSNSNTWMNVCVSSLSEDIQGLIDAYHKERDLRWSVIQNARENTNEKHTKFMDFLTDIMKEFTLNMLDGSDSSHHHLENSVGKRGSYSLKLEEALNDLGIALEEEMKTCSVSKGRDDKSFNKCILEKLDVPKERIDSECEIYSKYKSLLDDLEDTADLGSLFEELQNVQRDIQSLILDCAGEAQKLESRTCELHEDLLKEEKLLEKLAEVSVMHFPELILEHPEFDLLEYKNNWYMFKSSWQRHYFPVLESINRIEPAYVSKFSEDRVVIKEFDTCSETEKKSLIKKAILWNEIKCSSLAKIQALFNKDETGIYVMFPQVWDNLLDNPLPNPVDFKLACNLLQQILRGLVDMHERGLAHGAVHPMAVLRKEDKVLLDFNYDWKLLQDKLCLKGINFKDPSGDEFFKPTDMYGFGCLVLWVLFPNLSFTLGEKGVPNILPFQSIIQELLPGSAFSDLANLLSANTFLRPTSKDLCKKGFLKDVRSLSRP